MNNLNLWIGLKFTLLLTIVTFGSCQSNQSSNTEVATKHASVDMIQPKVTPYKNISIADAKRLLDASNDYIFLDVRTPSEVAAGQIAGSTTIDINSATFESEISKLDKQKHYAVYCKSGGRSARAAEFMQSQGFKNVSNMEGGYSAWKKAYE